MSRKLIIEIEIAPRVSSELLGYALGALGALSNGSMDILASEEMHAEIEAAKTSISKFHDDLGGSFVSFYEFSEQPGNEQE